MKNIRSNDCLENFKNQRSALFIFYKKGELHIQKSIDRPQVIGKLQPLCVIICLYKIVVGICLQIWAFHEFFFRKFEHYSCFQKAHVIPIL